MTRETPANFAYLNSDGKVDEYVPSRAMIGVIRALGNKGYEHMGMLRGRTVLVMLARTAEQQAFPEHGERITDIVSETTSMGDIKAAVIEYPATIKLGNGAEINIGTMGQARFAAPKRRVASIGV